MAKGGFVAYYRVSTSRQGASGLGLDAQREAVRTYLNGGKWHILSEHTEVESGRVADRPALAEALASARVHRVPLVVAKVDRLTRSLAFLTRLLDAGVEVRFCDLPQIEGVTGRFMLQQMASVAELEAGMISDRTKAALARSTKKLGGVRRRKDGSIVTLTPEAIAAGREAMASRSAARASDLAPTIKAIQASGMTSLAGIARALSERGIPTARGGETWFPAQVQRLLAAIE